MDIRVHVHAADEGGCGYNRMIWPGNALAAAGYDVTVFHGEDATAGALQVIWRDDEVTGRPMVLGLAEPPDCDVFVLQRPLRLEMVSLIPHLQRAGIAVVVEVDDDFESIDPRNSGYRTTHPQLSPWRNWRHLALACRIADHVTVTTPALEQRYGNGHCSVIPNFVPESYLTVEKLAHDGPPIVGWSGSIETHPDDLRVIGGSLADLVRKDVVQFRCVGTGVGVAEQLGLDDRYTRTIVDEERKVITLPWWATGWVDLPDYPTAVAQFDIGLVPLTLTPFNEAKSALKGLEYAATASPFIAARTGPYRALSHDTGVGVLVDRPKYWRNELLGLAGIAREIGEAYRDVVRERNWTYEDQAGRWLGAWMTAANRRAAMREGAKA